MRKPKTTITILMAVFTFSMLATSSASAGWFVEGEELASTAALATTASVSEEPTLSFGGTTVKCSGSTLNSVKPELAAPSKIIASSLSFSGCKVTSAGECTLEGTTIGTLPLTAELTEQTYPEDEATFTPKTATIFATIKLAGTSCAETGKLPITGKAATTLPTGQEEKNPQTIKANTTAASNTLKVGSTAASLTGAAGLKLGSGKGWFFVGAPRVEQVNFTGNEPVLIDHQTEAVENAIKITEVGGNDEIEWKSPTTGVITKNWPVVYVEGQKVKLEVKLSLDAAVQKFLETRIEGKPKLTGEAPFGGAMLKFEKEFSAAEIAANKGFLATGVIESTLPTKVLGAATSITWNWEYKPKGAAAVRAKLGNTTHPLYTLFNVPLAGPEIYLTALSLATSGIEEAKQPPTEAEAIAGIWKGFSNVVAGTPSVYIRTYKPTTAAGKVAVGTKVLEYYGEIVKAKKTLKEVYEAEITNKKRALTCPSVPYVEMLKNFAGRCGAWAQMLTDTFLNEGIKASEVVLFVKFITEASSCPVINTCVMLVKNWSFGAKGMVPFPYSAGETIDEEGVPGQGVKNPPPFFWDHVIVKAGPVGSDAALYDPSYGAGPFPGTEKVKPATEKSVLEEYQKKSIDGYCEPAVVACITTAESGGLGLVPEEPFGFP